MSGKLTEGFREILEYSWSEFVMRETDPSQTNFDSIIVALVRSCMKGNMRAIQTSLDRIDGKIATEIEVEYPKFYILYPYARIAADDKSIIDLPAIPEKTEIVELPDAAPADLDELQVMNSEVPTGSIRKVLDKLIHSPKATVTEILDVAKEVDKGNLGRGDPLVKYVIVCGLLRLVHEGKMAAVFEVLDQIDGKVADKVKIMGEDVFLTRYDEVAPLGAVKNDDGIYQVTADNLTNQWAAKLEAGKNRR